MGRSGRDGGNCKAFLRVLPCTDAHREHVRILDDHRTVLVREIRDFGKGKGSGARNYRSFPTDGVLNDLSQGEIYDVVLGKLLDQALAGSNVAIIGYGQTGAGKSTTVGGLCGLYENRGLAPRLLEELFDAKQKLANEWSVRYKISFVEMTKSHIVDLLATDGKRHQELNKISNLDVPTVYRGLQLLFLGEARRQRFDASPYASHRANSVFTVEIKRYSLLHSDPVITNSQINIVDMAGCDSCGTHNCYWKTCFETGFGNTAKSQLEQFLLFSRKKRNGKADKTKGLFIRYLSEFLKPQCLIRFIGHVRSSKKDLAITISILKFAKIAREIQPSKSITCTKPFDKLVCEELTSVNDVLNEQMDLDRMFSNNYLSENISDMRTQQIKNVLNEYLQNKNGEKTVLKVVTALQALRVFKELFEEMQREHLRKIKQMESVQTTRGPTDRSTGNSSQESRPSTAASDSQRLMKKKRASAFGADKMPKTIKTISKGYLEPSGMSLGLDVASNPRGFIIRSKKEVFLQNGQTNRKANKPNESNSITGTEKTFDGTYSSLSNQDNFDIQTKLPDYKAAWEAYASDERYDFQNLSAAMNMHEENYKKNLNEYNEYYASVQSILDDIDVSKEDLLTVQIHQQKPILCVDSRNKEQMHNVSVKIEDLVRNLLKDLNEKREKFLHVRANLKIDMGEYRRIKRIMNNDFAKYCSDMYNIQPTKIEHVQSVEEEMAPRASSENLEEQVRRTTFYRLQRRMVEVTRKIYKKKS